MRTRAGSQKPLMFQAPLTAQKLLTAQTRLRGQVVQPRRWARSVLLAAVLLSISLAACGGSDKTQVGTPAQQLAAVKAKVDASTSVHLNLRSSGVPASVSGVLAADGSGTHAPAFKGTLDARLSGFAAKVDVVAINKVLYLKLPFTTEFVQTDPKTYNAPNPAQLFATNGGISSLTTATTNPVGGERIRLGSEVLTTITGTLPGASVKKLLNIGDAAKTFKVTYGITDPGGELRTVSLTGPFFKAAISTYLLTLDRYGDPVAISKP